MKDHETSTRPPYWITWFIRPFDSIYVSMIRNRAKSLVKFCNESSPGAGDHKQYHIHLQIFHWISQVSFLGHQIIKLFDLRDVSFNAVLKFSFGHGLPRDLSPVSDDEMQRIAAQTGATVEFCWACTGYNGHSPILHYVLIMDMHIQNLSCCTVFKLMGVVQPLLASEDRNPLGHGSTSRLNIYMYVWIWVCIDIHFYMHL